MGKVITIDGPAGAGKSTASKLLASRLSYCYLDTGALYRTIAYKAIREGIALDDEEALSLLSRNINIILKSHDGRTRIFLDGEEMTDGIRTEEVSMASSVISARQCVRDALLTLQREAGVQGRIVAEGRDMGTVVFPDADYKFYLDASLTARARRRYDEIIARIGHADYEKIEKEIIIRDAQDKERALSPLMPAVDAIIIDSTDMTVQEVVDTLLRFIRQAQGCQPDG